MYPDPPDPPVPPVLHDAPIVTHVELPPLALIKETWPLPQGFAIAWSKGLPDPEPLPKLPSPL
jgi:hypothetical protein